MSAAHSNHLLDVQNSGSSEEDNPKYSGSYYADDERYTLELYKLVLMVVMLHYPSIFSGLKSDNMSSRFTLMLLAWQPNLKSSKK